MLTDGLHLLSNYLFTDGRNLLRFECFGKIKFHNAKVSGYRTKNGLCCLCYHGNRT